MKSIVGQSYTKERLFNRLQAVGKLVKDDANILEVHDPNIPVFDESGGFGFVTFEHVDASDRTQSSHMYWIDVDESGCVKDEKFFCRWYGDYLSKLEPTCACEKGNSIAKELHKAICPWARFEAHQRYQPNK